MALFDWFKKEADTNSPTRTKRQTPQTRDFTDSLQVNEALTKGLYFGEYPGLKLASALAMAPVKIPVFFQGFPIAKTEDDLYNEMLEDIIKQFTVQMNQTHIQRRREGTIWIWPKWSGKLIWEFIPDQTVTDIIRDLENNEIISIITEENLIVSTGYGQTVSVIRKRIFTKQRIEVSYSGFIPAGLKDGSMRNPIGMLPVPFSFEADGDDIRGHSLYGRIISDLKSYHDIDLSLSTLLSKFKTKISQGVSDIKEFCKANGYSSETDFFTNFDLTATDMLIYRKDLDAPPELLSAELSSYQAYMEALKLKYRKVVEGTGVPEIAWGLKTEGNLASVEENMKTMIMYIRGDQRECTEPWEKVFTASLKLMIMANMAQNKEFKIEISWNDLEAISDEAKSIIFKNFAEGISKLMGSVALTKEMLHKLWKTNYPNATEQDYDIFIKGLADMGVFRATVNADPVTALDSMGLLSKDDNL